MADYVQKQDCEECGHKNSQCLYSDGSTYCWSADCGHVGKPSEEKSKQVRSASPSTLSKNFKPKAGEVRPLNARKISQKTCDKFKYEIGSLYGKTCQIMNYYSEENAICAQKFRFQDKTFSWDGDAKAAGLFGRQLWSPNPRLDIVVTEGELDAMSIAEIQDCKYPVVSIHSGAASARKVLKNEAGWLSKFKNVILCFDQDEAGRKATKECVTLFEPGKVKIVRLPLKDANDMLKNNRVAELQKCLLNAQEYRPDGILTGSDVSLVELRKPEEKGYPLPYPTLNEMTRGLHKGRLVLVAAASGTGKSSLLKELGLDLVKNSELTVGNIFLEESLRYTMMSYIALDNNKPVHLLAENPDIIPKDAFAASYDDVLGGNQMYFYDHFGSMSTDDLIAKIEYMAVASEVDFILLDHISMVVSGQQSSREGERKDIDILMTKLRSLIQRTGVGIVAVVHIKRRTANKDFTEGEQLRLSDLRGSASLEQLSDFVIGLERDQQGDDKTKMLIRVLKNRLTGKTGPADMIEYNIGTGRLDIDTGLF